MSDKRRRPSTLPLEEAFGVPFEPPLLERALTHRSYAYENGGLPTNERLEFLGDSVLGVVIPSAPYHTRPALPGASSPSCGPAWSTCTRSPTWPAVSAR